MTNQDELSQAEINELQPDEVAVLSDEALEKLENAETPDQVDEVIKEAQGEQLDAAQGAESVGTTQSDSAEGAASTEGESPAASVGESDNHPQPEEPSELPAEPVTAQESEESENIPVI